MLRSLYPLIEIAVKMAGYAPENALPVIMESLTHQEYEVVEEFLSYVHNNGKGFGRANFGQVVDQFLHSVTKGLVTA